MRILVLSQIKRALSFVLLITVFGTVDAIADDDPYLKALEAESKVDVGVQTETSKPASIQAKQPTTQDIQRKELESRLSRELPATFRTYQLLSLEDKIKVVKLYFANEKDMEKATRYLFELYYK